MTPNRSSTYFQSENEPHNLHQQIEHLKRELYRRDVKIQNQDRIIQDLRRSEAEKHRSLEDKIRRKIWDENCQKIENKVKWRVEAVREECEEKLRKSENSEPKPRFLDVEPEGPSPNPTSDFDFINVPETFARLMDKVHYANARIAHLEASLNRKSIWIENFFKDNTHLVSNMLIQNQEELPRTLQASLRRLESIGEDVEAQFAPRQVLREVNGAQRKPELIKDEQSYCENVENLSRRIEDVNCEN